MTLTKSTVEAGIKFTKKIGSETNLRTIDENLRKWKQVCSVQDRHKGNSGRKNPYAIKKIRADNKMSIRRHAIASCITKSLVHRTSKEGPRFDALLAPDIPKTEGGRRNQNTCTLQ